MPEYPFAVDVYAGKVHLLEYPRRRALREGSLEQTRREVVDAIVGELGVPEANVFISTHVPKAWGREQYEATGREGVAELVEENGLKFEVRLGAYLDSGLFMDHRNTRAKVREEASGRRFLNLFAYTGAFSVYAAAGGAAATTTVDLSGTYLDWARRNFALNRLEGPTHRFLQADVLQWIAQERGTYDLVVLDPPSHSTSKRMERAFDVQKDHPRLLRDVLALLSETGVLYFSTNYLGFQLDPQALAGAAADELTPRSIPEDFRQKDIHRCWRIARGAR
jgi:23S rRNA (cytosine1962-C5)-methyltransferase